MDQRDYLASIYEKKLNIAIERMAQRLGGTFVHNDRWQDLVGQVQDAEKADESRNQQR